MAKSKNVVTYEYDETNDMVSIEYNGKSIGFGNEWDDDVKTVSVLESLCKLLKIKFT